jgi:hypothetical protein
MEIKRNYFKWNINEVLRLQREYELLGMTIHEIAERHSRSGEAIFCKLEREGFIENWALSRGIEEFLDSNSELCKYKSLILDGDNLSSVTTSETDTDTDTETNTETDTETNTETDTETDTETEKSLDTPKEITANESIHYLDLRNMFLLTLKLIYIIFQFVEKNFTEKMIF